jgi:hypothetical protein
MKKFLFMLVMSFVIAIMSLTTIASGTAQAALAFHSGFECGNTFEWYAVTGAPTIQSTIKHTGTYAMRCYTPTAGQVYCNATSQFVYKITAYVYIAIAPDTDTKILGNCSDPVVILTPTRYLKIFSVTGTTQLSLNTWYRISLSANGLASGTVKVYLNGALEATATGLASSTLNLVGVISAASADLYFDDIAVDSSTDLNDLGDIRTLLSLPNAAGTYTQFDTYAGSATHYQNVDDAPGAISDTDYNQQADTAAALDTYNLQDASTIGIGTSDTINAVRVLARMKRGTGSAGGGKAVQWRDNSTDGYQSIAATTAFAWYFSYYATMPADSGAWTQTRFNALEVGANHGKGTTDAQDTFISAQMVMVAYTPAAGAEPDITVSPTSYNFGIVTASSTPYTTTTYFTITNASTMQTDQTIAVTTSTWSGGVGWTHSDTATPGTNTAGLLANRGGTWGTGDVIVKYSSPNYIYENCPASTNYSFGLKLIAPTGYTDGAQKQIVVRITAVAG